MPNVTSKNIVDLVGANYMKDIQHTIGHISCIPVALLGADNVPFSSAANLHVFQYAKRFDSIPKPEEHGPLCTDPSDLLKPSILSGPTGLKSALIPIVVEGAHVSSWYISQVRMRPFEISPGEIIRDIPLVSPEKLGEHDSRPDDVSDHEFENIIAFLATSTSAITDLGAANDVLNKQNAELLALTKKLDTSLNAFREFINLADIGTYLVDFNTGQLLMYNTTYQEGFDLPNDYITDKRCFELMGFDDFCPFCQKDKLLDSHNEPLKPYVWENFNEKFGIWLNITSRAVRWVDGRIVMMTSYIDITTRKQEEERIAHLAYHDQNLNIPNAVKLNEDLRKKSGEKTYLLFSDVKALKDINTVYGRAAGDGLLKAIAAWLSAFADDHIRIYRIDGDNFAVLLHNVSMETVEAFADKIFLRFESPWLIDLNGVMQRIYASAQVGFVRMNATPDSYSSLLNLAEKVLSFAKTANKSLFFDEGMNQQYQDYIQLSVCLKSCVLNDMEGFSIHYQPVVDAQTGKWCGLEALCRWVMPSGKSVPPSVFIDEAEKLGIVSIIDSWVLQHAISQIKEIGLDQLPSFFLSVNLSPIQLRDKQLASFVLASLEKYDYPLDKFSLEITETAEVQFNELTFSLLGALQEAGIKLSLDDFGTGYATFSNLSNLPVDILKIDRSFITGIEDNVYLQQTMNIMMQFAHLVGLDVTVEGVETPVQYEIIKKNGANHIQGFYFSKPLPIDDLVRNLSEFQ